MNKRQNKGITLVALIITIIVLLILIAVVLRIVITDGVINKAQETVKLYESKQITEGIQIEEIEETYSRIVGLGNGKWNGEVHSPKLGNGMVAIYWDESGNEINEKMDDFDEAKWYNYDESEWANAKTKDGSYWVWIPRYEYKIDTTGVGVDTAKAGTVDVRFIQTTINSETAGYTTSVDGITISSDGYTIHPAFTDNVEQGGWDKEISGIWVAKFEMAREESSDSGVTWRAVAGTSDTATVNEGVNRKRIVSKPRSKGLEIFKSEPLLFKFI